MSTHFAKQRPWYVFIVKVLTLIRCLVAAWPVSNFGPEPKANMIGRRPTTFFNRVKSKSLRETRYNGVIREAKVLAIKFEIP